MGFVPALAGAAFGTALLAEPIYSGQQQLRSQRRALRAQSSAQQRAEAQASAELRREEDERRRLNRRMPDVAALLSAEATSRRGSASTLLGGVRAARPTLGQTSLLGGF